MKFSREECNKKRFSDFIFIEEKALGLNKYYLEIDLIFTLNIKWYVIDRSGD